MYYNVFIILTGDWGTEFEHDEDGKVKQVIKSGALNGWGQVTNLKGKKLKQKIQHIEKIDLQLAKQKCPDFVNKDNQFCAGKKSEHYTSQS